MTYVDLWVANVFEYESWFKSRRQQHSASAELAKQVHCACACRARVGLTCGGSAKEAMIAKLKEVVRLDEEFAAECMKLVSALSC